jgi:hypothetical protein
VALARLLRWPEDRIAAALDYVVGSVEETIGDGRFASLAAVHDALLVPEDDHVRLVRTRGEPGFEPA